MFRGAPTAPFSWKGHGEILSEFMARGFARLIARSIHISQESTIFDLSPQSNESEGHVLMKVKEPMRTLLHFLYELLASCVWT